MRQIVLFIAMSLDGYVADTQGGVEWLAGDGSDAQNMGSYAEFYESIDTVILGKKTYDQIVTVLSPDKWVYEDKMCYVITNQQMPSTVGIQFTSQSLASLVEKLKGEEQGKDIWICGGASIANQLMAENLIDRYHISVIPKILGDGIPLFSKHEKSVDLQLVSTHSYNGITDLIYRPVGK